MVSYVISPEKYHRSGAIGRVKVGCRSDAFVGYLAVKVVFDSNTSLILRTTKFIKSRLTQIL